MRMLPKFSVGIITALLVGSLAVGPISAKAATQDDVVNLWATFSLMKMRIISTRKIIFWDAKANQTAQCYMFYVPSNVATPPTGQGFYAEQWALYRTSSNVTEAQCYAQP